MLTITRLFSIIYGPGSLNFNPKFWFKWHGLCCITMHWHTKTRLHTLSWPKKELWFLFSHQIHLIPSVQLLAIPESEILMKAKCFNMVSDIQKALTAIFGDNCEVVTASSIELSHRASILNKSYSKLKINNVLYFIFCYWTDCIYICCFTCSVYFKEPCLVTFALFPWLNLLFIFF